MFLKPRLKIVARLPGLATLGVPGTASEDGVGEMDWGTVSIRGRHGAMAQGKLASGDGTGQDTGVGVGDSPGRWHWGLA